MYEPAQAAQAYFQAFMTIRLMDSNASWPNEKGKTKTDDYYEWFVFVVVASAASSRSIVSLTVDHGFEKSKYARYFTPRTEFHGHIKQLLYVKLLV